MVETITRFPPPRQEQVRAELLSILQLVMSQASLRRADEDDIAFLKRIGMGAAAQKILQRRQGSPQGKERSKLLLFKKSSEVKAG